MLDVLRQYVAEWPFPRPPGDAVPLNQSWRGQRKQFTVQLQNKNFDADLHTNATIGQLADAVKAKANLNKNYFIQLYAEQNGAHILDTELLIVHALPQNATNAINFFAKVVGNHAKVPQRRTIARPDKALADYPEFLTATIELFELALEINASKLCSSIQKLLLILQCNTKSLAAAINSRQSLASFYDSPCAAKNWYNFLLTRVLLLPAADEEGSAEIYQNFFATDGPSYILAALSTTAKMMQLSDSETRLGLIETLFELTRFIGLVMLTQTQLARAERQEKESETLQHLWNVMYKLDDVMYNLARNEAETFDTTIPHPIVKLEYGHFEGVTQMCWQLANMTGDGLHPDVIINCFKLGLETFVCFAAISPLSRIQRDGQTFCSSHNFQEFVIQMLFHPMDEIRRWTYTFFTVLYTSKYLEKPDDPQVTLIFVNHLYTSRDRCEQHADIADYYFNFLHDLLDEIWNQSNLINGFARLKEIICWLENRVAQKEANDVLLKGQGQNNSKCDPNKAEMK